MTDPVVVTLSDDPLLLGEQATLGTQTEFGLRLSAHLLERFGRTVIIVFREEARHHTYWSEACKDEEIADYLEMIFSCQHGPVSWKDFIPEPIS